MPEQYATFKIFKDRETADELAVILTENDIDHIVEEDALSFEPSYAFNPLNKDYRLKLQPQDFEAANAVFRDYFKAQLDTLDKDYYLFGFSDFELQEIIAKPDEWGFLDYELAQKLLKERGKEVQPERIEALAAARNEKLDAPENVDSSLIFIGYALSIFMPLIGFFFGMAWLYGKKTLPNGKKSDLYSKSVRAHGERIFWISIVVVAIGFFRGNPLTPFRTFL